MSADILRRAAARLREAAASATPGPWEVGPNFGARDNRVYVRPEGGFDWVGSTDDPHKVMACQVSNVAEFRANAAFVALMHPPVALALADLLTSPLLLVQAMHKPCDDCAHSDCVTHRRLVALARAILREDS